MILKICVQVQPLSKPLTRNDAKAIERGGVSQQLFQELLEQGFLSSYALFFLMMNKQADSSMLCILQLFYPTMIPASIWVKRVLLENPEFPEHVDTVQKTMEQSTQWGVSLPNTFPMKRHLKSRNPALNIPRRHEAVATDTVFSDTPAVDSGVKQAQVFVGRDTLVADAYPMKSGKQFVNTLEDNIRRQGAMDKLLSDSAKT